jgi:hypothetical protein
MSAEKPKVNSAGQRELDKVGAQFDAFEKNVKDLGANRMEGVKREESEPQTKLSQKEIGNSRDIYLKPKKTAHSKEVFNEKFRKDYEFQKEYVQLIAENYELIGSMIEMWTKPFPGMPAEFWEVPVNTPVWAPRYVAENLRKCNYHVFSMQENVGVTGSDQMGTYTGKMVVDTVKQRLDARPVSGAKSIFMGASGF